MKSWVASVADGGVQGASGPPSPFASWLRQFFVLLTMQLLSCKRVIWKWHQLVSVSEQDRDLLTSSILHCTITLQVRGWIYWNETDRNVYFPCTCALTLKLGQKFRRSEMVTVVLYICIRYIGHQHLKHMQTLNEAMLWENTAALLS